MGLFDTLRITCPICSDVVEMQVKPTLIDGTMQEWRLSDAPEAVLERVRGWEEECDCGFTLQIQRDLCHIDEWRIMVTRYFRIDHRH